MKLRIENQTVRFRLSPKDIERLTVEGRVIDTLQITPDAVWAYSLEAAEGINEPRVDAETQNMKIILPDGQLNDWISSPDLEWEFNSDKLHVMIEKDLKPNRQANNL